MKRPTPLSRPVRDLARLFGVHTSYVDVFKRRRERSADVVIAAARLLGAHSHDAVDVADALRARTLEIWHQVVEPVVIARPGRGNRFDVRLPEHLAGIRLSCRLRLEDGTERTWDGRARRSEARDVRNVEGVRHLRAGAAIPGDVPVGYHDLTVECGGRAFDARVICAPVRAWAPTERTWGAFLPLYALHSDASWGAGDLSDLSRMQEWIGGLGGDVVSILPVLAAFLDAPFDPSPYAPVSRLFWNEFYVDSRQSPELAGCRQAQRLLASAPFERDIARARATSRVDYRKEAVLRRRPLELLAASLNRADGARAAELRRHVAANPALHDYAAFRAVMERRQRPWSEWPARLRDGSLESGDYSQAAYRYHLYAQWLTGQQLEAAATADRSRPGLYLDYPLGVHADGYDTWRHRDAFVTDASGGAPPDAVYTQGQDWSFPPLNPEGIRKQGYRYVIDCLRHQLGPAKVLRIDHVMGLHRLYWIPKGFPASEGVYVGYRPEEWYAILSLESHRHSASIVGENLGTVPPSVNAAMARHGIQKMYVVQYEAQPRTRPPLPKVPAGSVASLNTHDMPPMAAYLRGLDLQTRVEQGLLSRGGLGREREDRHRLTRALAGFFRREGAADSAPPDAKALMKAALRWLAGSRASVVLVNLEDLWMEQQSQNLPGTGVEQANWTRKARYSFEQFSTNRSLVEMLRSISQLRASRRRRRASQVTPARRTR